MPHTLAPGNLRADQRLPNQLRPLSTSFGTLGRVDGSASFAFGDVQVLCSVTGPAEVRIRDELVDRAAVEVSVRSLPGVSGTTQKSLSALLSSTLSPLLLTTHHPRSLIQLVSQTLSSPALPTSQSSTFPALPISEKAATVNAGTLACMDAALGMRGVVYAVGVAVLPAHLPDAILPGEEEAERMQEDEKEGQGEEVVFLVDPTAMEEARALSTHVFAFSFGAGVGGDEGTVVGAESLGVFSEEQYLHSLDLVRTAVQEIRDFVRSEVEQRVREGAERDQVPADAKRRK